MKTIEQFKEEFDEFLISENNYTSLNVIDEGKIKNYIFQELLPQVLSEIIVKNCTIESYNDAQLFNRYIKQKAKEMGIKF